MALTGLHTTDYETALKAFIISKEGSKTKVHTDGVGVPTIGAGYALTINKNWTADFSTAGITTTAAQQTALQALISESDAYLKDTSLTTAQKESQVKALVTTYNASANAITLSSTQVGELFLAIKSKYEQIVKDKLGTALYNSLANTEELVALVDLAYNGGGGLFGTGLVNALTNNDRAEAWFQIRYQSNGGNSYQTVGTGMAERRVTESNLFDLYPTDANENYYKQVMQMYTQHKDTIYAVEHNNFTPSGNNNPIKSAYENDGLIDTKLAPAKEYLVENYAQDKTIDGDIIVGQGIGEYGEAYADEATSDINDTLQGTSKNDLIFGERGDDSLFGGKGDDVLIGGSGKDYLEGGEGFDTYYAGDGDTIQDSDGKGEIFFNDTLLKGGTYDKEKEAYLSEDKTVEYRLDNETLKVTINSETLTINNFNKKSNDLGVNLTDKLGKEVAIVIDTTGSMHDDIEAAKQSAKMIATNIFRTNTDENVYSKISIVTFTNNNIKTVGTYTDYNSFQSGINSVNVQGGSMEYHCAAMIEGMSNFTKDNGLDKQMFLITDEPGDDNERMGEVIAMANSFGSEMKLLSNLNSGESSYDNRVKINVISIGRNLTHLKRFSDETGGIFLETNSISELEDALFDVSNLGTMNDDIIFGNERDNILDGGAGDDLLYGGAGDDTYIFGYGYGNDLIHDYAYDVAGDSIDAGNDTVRFINGVTKDDLIVEDSGKDLIIKLKGSDDSLTIKGFYEEHTRVENFTFESGVTLSADEIDELTKPNVIRGGFGNKVLYGTDRKDEIHGGVGRSEIYAKGGNDTIYSGIGNSYIDAGDGDDTIYGSVGKMVVRGGKGNDTMYGGIGNATYLFGKDDGDDLIVCGVGKSSILFDEEIEKESVFITSKDNNLFIQYSDEGSIVVKNHKRLKSISLNDGSYITSNDINRIIQEMNSFAASNDLDITNLNEMKNSDEFMQIVMSGWR